MSTPSDADLADATREPIAIYGTWNEVIDVSSGDTTFTNSSIEDTFQGNVISLPIVEYDNAARTLLTRRPDTGKYTALVWTPITNSRFYACHTSWEVASLAEANASTTNADARDPERVPCRISNGVPWPWISYIPPIELRGEWEHRGVRVSVRSDEWLVGTSWRERIES